MHICFIQTYYYPKIGIIPPPLLNTASLHPQNLCRKYFFFPHLYLRETKTVGFPDCMFSAYQSSNIQKYSCHGIKKTGTVMNSKVNKFTGASINEDTV